VSLILNCLFLAYWRGGDRGRISELCIWCNQLRIEVTARFVLFVKFLALRGIDVSHQSVTVSVISCRVICVSFWRFVLSVRNAVRFSVSPIGDAVKLPWRLCFTALML
jgi:hypothetical protein